MSSILQRLLLLQTLTASLQDSLEELRLRKQINQLILKHESLQTKQNILKKCILSHLDDISSMIGSKAYDTNGEHGNVEITLIRHAQTEFNVIEESKHNDTERLSAPNNFINCGLTQTGMFQCNALKFHFDLLIVSPMKRCLQTLEHSKIRYSQLITLDIFREYKTDFCDFMTDEETVNETEFEIINRTTASKEVLKYIMNHNKELRSIGIITHHDFIWYFTSEIIQNERFGTGLQNAEFVTINGSAL